MKGIFNKYFNKSKKIAINSTNINNEFNFDDLESCRKFLCNLHVGDSRVEHIDLANGERVKMQDIPEDQIIKRAREIRSWLFGKLK